ncbi:MAG: transketolase C-terminal domain-containing protein [Candidatus Binataceae bacterium]
MPAITYRQAIAQALREELARDERVFIIGEGVGYGGGAFAATAGMLAQFGERRIRDAPRSDAMLVATAIGAAMGGLMPVVEARNATLAVAAAAQLANYRALPIVVRAPLGEGGGAGAFGNQAVRMITPVSPADAKGMLKSAIRSDGPVIVLEHRLLYDVTGEVPGDADYSEPLEGARVLRAGSDLTIVAYSRAVDDAVAAAAILESRGVSAELIDLRALVPLDTATVGASIAKTRRSIIASGGLPGAVAEIAAGIYRVAYPSLLSPIESVDTGRTSDIVNTAMRLAGA